MLRTLVLNLDEQPLNFIPHLYAYVDVWCGTAEVVETYKDKFILLGEGKKDLAPSIIKLKYYVNKVPHMAPAPLTKTNVYIRDNYTCVYTGERLKDSDLSWDHVIPTSKGGKHSWGNLVTCHRKINELKADFILGVDEEVKNFPIPRPFRPHYLMLMQNGAIQDEWKKYLFIDSK